MPTSKNSKLLKKRKESITSVAKLHKRETAFHEAAHAIVARHLGVPSLAVIAWVGKPPKGFREYMGYCFFTKKPPTKFCRAVIAFAGQIGEYLSKYPVKEWPHEHFKDYEVFIYANDTAELSQRDSERIALLKAWKIIVERRNEIEKEAKLLMRDALDISRVPGLKENLPQLAKSPETAGSLFAQILAAHPQVNDRYEQMTRQNSI
jgi:hypothetical protein